jgi:DNA-binding response OmpR family regulator
MGEQIRLLYVDDEDSMRLLIKNQFVHEGFFVDTADDGDTAVEVLKKSAYDIIVLDIKMPRMNGIEVLKYIKQHRIPSRVIILTAVDDLTIAIEAVKNGADDYLTKPYDLDNLLACIHKVLAK